jgi:hypothetical protein
MNSTESTDLSDSVSFILRANPTVLIHIYRYGLGLIFLLGFIGNVFGTMTFRRPVLRSTSTGTLFLLLAISDTIVLLVEIFDFIEIGITQMPILFDIYDHFCRFRWFMKGLFQFCSAWILTSIAADRWIRARLPFQVNRWCTRRNVFIVTLTTIIIGCIMHSHLLLTDVFGRLNPAIANEACGPLAPFSDYAVFYFSRWPIVQVVTKLPVSKN